MVIIRAIKLSFVAWAACGLGMLVASGPALADTITVTNTNDAGAGPHGLRFAAGFRAACPA